MLICDSSHGVKQVFIDNRRWDPITAFTSSAIGTLADLTEVTAGVFLSPYEKLQRMRTARERQGKPKATNFSTAE